MTGKDLRLEEHLQRLRDELNIEPLSREFIFQRKYAAKRSEPYPEDKERTWLNVLLHTAMTPAARSEIYPGRFDLGNTQANEGGKLIDLVNEIRKPSPLKGGKLEQIQTRNLHAVLKGIQAITGKSLFKKSCRHTAKDLKVIKLLFHITTSRNRSALELIKRPEKPKHHTLEFRNAGMDPRNPEGTLLVSDVMSYLSVEIPSERLHHINQAVPDLPAALLRLEHENERISQTLKHRFFDDRDAMTTAYQTFADTLNAFTPPHSLSSNTLDETLYIHLRSLPILHYAGGYASLFRFKAKARKKIPNADKAHQALLEALAAHHGHDVDLFTRIASIDGLEATIKSCATPFSTLISKITDIKTDNRDLISTIKHAKYIHYLYYHFYLGIQETDQTWLTPLDIVSTLCTTRTLQVKTIPHSPYWYGQKSQGKDILRLLKTHAFSIEAVREHDAVAHSINQIVHYRTGAVYSAILGNNAYYEAWMNFQIARISAYAACLKPNDLDLITKNLWAYDEKCFRTVTTLEIPFGDKQDLALASINHFLNS